MYLETSNYLKHLLCFWILKLLSNFYLRPQKGIFFLNNKSENSRASRVKQGININKKGIFTLSSHLGFFCLDHECLAGVNFFRALFPIID